MQYNKHVVLVSSGQPSLNPRLVKEADTLIEAGYHVTVLYTYWNTWGTQLDVELLGKKKWKAIRVAGAPGNKSLIYYFSKFIYKASNWFTRLTGLMLVADIAIARGAWFLTKRIKKIEADIYIGHNLGALPAIVMAAKKHNKLCGFDAEDFHRNEVTDDISSLDVKLKKHIEDKYIAQLNYLTVSSPLIGDEYKRLYPQIKQEVLLNSFPKIILHQAIGNNGGSKLKLFWFSQTVGVNRGIENIIAALQILKNIEFELHLLGDVTNTIQTAFNHQVAGSNSKIYFHAPIAPDGIINFASQFDIGFASEQNVPFNRDICLTNKLFTYLQGGLTILASDTKAQATFIIQHTVAGKTYNNNDTTTIAEALLYYQNNRQALQQDKDHNYQLGQTSLNWDMEKKRFLSIVDKTLAGE
jgi:glycosyltransferase involved in cell wall biosynthesis